MVVHYSDVTVQDFVSIPCLKVQKGVLTEKVRVIPSQ